MSTKLTYNTLKRHHTNMFRISIQFLSIIYQIFIYLSLVELTKFVIMQHNINTHDNNWWLMIKKKIQTYSNSIFKIQTNLTLNLFFYNQSKSRYKTTTFVTRVNDQPYNMKVKAKPNDLSSAFQNNLYPPVMQIYH